MRGRSRPGRAVGAATAARDRLRRQRPGGRRSFIAYALASLGTFLMAARVVGWLEGPLWLSGAFVGAGTVLGLYYLCLQLARWRRERRRQPLL